MIESVHAVHGGGVVGGLDHLFPFKSLQFSPARDQSSLCAFQYSSTLRKAHATRAVCHAPRVRMICTDQTHLHIHTYNINRGGRAAPTYSINFKLWSSLAHLLTHVSHSCHSGMWLQYTYNVNMVSFLTY